MKEVFARDLFQAKPTTIDQLVTMTGWVKTIRSGAHVSFLELNDGTDLRNIQVVLSAAELENYQAVIKLNLSATVKVVGQIALTPKAAQPFEIQATAVEVLGQAAADYPLQKKQHSFEFLRTQAHLRPRTATFYAVFKIRSLAAFAIHQFFQERGYVYVNTPIITSSDSEGAGEMFKVSALDFDHLPLTSTGTVDFSKEFFKKATNLTVSGQLPDEGFALAFRNTYTFGPAFRAEDSHTTRHTAEFWMIEPEMAFCDLAEMLQIEEQLIKYVINYLMTKAQPELMLLTEKVDADLIKKLKATTTSDFEVISYDHAIELLQQAPQTFTYPVKWGVALQSEHERYLCEEVYQRPVFVINYPEAIKAFYMRRNDDGKTVAAADLLVPGIGELVGGSQREERPQILSEKIATAGLNPAEYQWYLDLRRYGETSHSGFGLGFERLIMFLTGMTNIRDVIPYPRTPGEAEF
ncbi:asparagine--tRNA ligase [Lapidilactobacillus gannanensis]|uniref:Asparagine--tRNA ligase n=1 Tax=Lapidilactobacillus gannanensis TaxID=2486002 RepID=A0ABW4BLG7_9LACO|nr:asparagine--tRNA ligase [Lapidilactobacillus gannanensis]